MGFTFIFHRKEYVEEHPEELKSYQVAERQITNFGSTKLYSLFKCSRT